MKDPLKVGFRKLLNRLYLGWEQQSTDKQNKKNLVEAMRRLDGETIQVSRNIVNGGRARVVIVKRFEPSREFIADKMSDFFRKGGVIRKVTIEFRSKKKPC